MEGILFFVKLVLLDTWPILYALIAAIVFRNTVKHKLRFFIMTALLCYGVQSIVVHLGTYIYLLFNAKTKDLFIFYLISWVAAIFVIYWFYKVYEANTN